jgi:hypothetical protein
MVPYALARGLLTIDGKALAVVYGSGTRVNATAAAASTAEAAMPAGAKVIELRATAAIAIRFGNTGVGAAAVDANSILFPAGEKVLQVPESALGVPYDFFRVIRAAGTDAAVQLEKVDVQA